jgi:UDP-N-acetylmuramoyl-tripeptide--D-alanyl-D-alanine ligase
MHNVVNALGAAAAAIATGASLEQVARGLAQMRPVAGRLQWKAARNGGWIIDDSYNANPSSMHAAIDVLAAVPGRRWLVIGEMAELGAHAPSSHSEAGSYAHAHGVERLFALGELTRLTVRSFGDGAQWFADAADLTRAVEAQMTPDVRLLVKGSRVNRLERVVDALVLPQRKAG